MRVIVLLVGVLQSCVVAHSTELVSQLGAVVHKVTSAPDTVAQTIDGDHATFWQSGACNPGGWTYRPENALLGACAQGLCSSSGAIPAPLEQATDGNMAYTTLNIVFSVIVHKSGGVYGCTGVTNTASNASIFQLW